MAFQLLLRATVEACAAAGPPWLLEKRQFEWRTGEAGLEYLKPPPNDFLPKVAGLDANRPCPFVYSQVPALRPNAQPMDNQ